MFNAILLRLIVLDAVIVGKIKLDTCYLEPHVYLKVSSVLALANGFARMNSAMT